MKDSTLLKLRKMREENVVNMVKWALGDLYEMKETLVTAKKIAEFEENQGSLLILDEKIDQITEATTIKENFAQNNKSAEL